MVLRSALGCIGVALLAFALALSTSSAADLPPLVAGAKAGKVAAVSKLLAAGADIEAGDGENLTALNWAAYNGHLAVVKLLVEHGAKVDAQANKNGWTPLMNAAAQGFPKVAAYLLDHGANIDAHSGDGSYTPLMYASRKTKKAVVLLLLDRGAAVNAIDGSNRTALDFAGLQNDKSIAEVLIAHGGKPGS